MRHHILIVCADSRVEPELLTGAIDDARRPGAPRRDHGGSGRDPRGPSGDPSDQRLAAAAGRPAERAARGRRAGRGRSGLALPGGDRAVPQRLGAPERGLAGRRARARGKRGVGRAPCRPRRRARRGDRPVPALCPPPPADSVRASQGACGVAGGRHGHERGGDRGRSQPSVTPARGGSACGRRPGGGASSLALGPARAVARRAGRRLRRHRDEPALHDPADLHRRPSDGAVAASRLRRAVADRLGAPRGRHAEVRAPDPPRRQPRRGRHHGARRADRARDEDAPEDRPRDHRRARRVALLRRRHADACHLGGVGRVGAQRGVARPGGADRPVLAGDPDRPLRAPAVRHRERWEGSSGRSWWSGSSCSARWA